MLRSVLAVAAVAALALVPAIACSTASPSTTGVTPVTGIVIRSDSLVTGIGCGPNPTQLFKYVAIARSDFPPLVQYSNSFDCFADGVFVNLPTSDNGNQSFTIDILAFNKADYVPQQGCIETGATVPTTASGFVPTWRTTCKATQQLNVAVLAVCDPLVLVRGPDAGAVPLCPAPVPPPPVSSDAGASEAGDGGGGSDASKDAAADAPNDSSDGAADAGDAATDSAVDAPNDAGDAAG